MKRRIGVATIRQLTVAVVAMTMLGAGRAAAQDAVKHELALELLEAMHVPDQLQASLDATLTSQLQSLEMNGMQDVLRQFYARYLTWDALKDRYADMYAAQFTEDDLRAMAAFYRSPPGQRLARATPRLIVQGQELGEAAVRAHLPELRQMILRHVQTSRPPARP
jgi:hypothetical protein